MKLFIGVVLVLVLLPGAGRGGDKDLYICFKKGNSKPWFVTGDLRPPNARCKLYLRTQAKAPAPKNPGSSHNSKPKAKSRKRWKPPHTVYWKKSDITAGGKLKDIDVIIKKASETYNIPEAFIRGVIEIESSYKVKALSHKGAMGLMQLMPGTAGDMGVTDAYDPFQNVMGGTKFLRILANRFNGDIPKVLAAYHAGGRSVSDAGGIPYQGSDGYVRKVLKHYYRIRDEERTAVSSEP